MIDIIHSLITGVIQGVTEFLPISSSAHLVLLPYIFGWKYQGLILDVALHFGTVIALLAFFWRDWVAIFQQLFRVKGRKKEIIDSLHTEFELPKNFFWQIILATIPAGMAGYLLQDKVERYFHSPMLIAINLGIFGLALWLVDYKAKQDEKIEKITFKQSFFIGIAQCLALVPGVSRSGITMLASRGAGLNRSDAARFSFLLGTPAMIGAFALEIRKIDVSSLNFAFILSVAASAIAGFLAIKYLLNYLKKADFRFFAYYRLVLAIIVIIISILR
ncbi:MAG: undecaprenyl-diphosphate phosphatase [Candidatus Berkelbacteria bacterium]